MQELDVLRNVFSDWTTTDQSKDWNVVNYIAVAPKYTQGTLIRSLLLLSDARQTFLAETGSQGVPIKVGEDAVSFSYGFGTSQGVTTESCAQYYTTLSPVNMRQLTQGPGKCFSL